MIEEFRSEEIKMPYRSPGLSSEGLKVYARSFEEAIEEGNEDTLARALSAPELWKEFEPSPQGGVRKTDPVKASASLAKQEFNTFYVRGLARKLLEEGEEFGQIYLAGEEPGEGDCPLYVNRVFRLRHIYAGHRARYRPTNNPEAFSIPCGPGCEHTIRRLPSDMKAMIELEERQFGAAFHKT
jgi:hypothetical protein